MIYFIRDSLSGHIKIGFADDPWRRLSKIQSDCPGEVSIAALEDGGPAREAELHALFKDARLRGEWFAPTLTIQSYIAKLGAAKKPLTTKSRRFWNGMTDEELAGHVSVHRATLTRIRQGKYRPSPAVAIEIQRATGLSAVRLAFGDLADEAIDFIAHSANSRAA